MIKNVNVYLNKIKHKFLCGSGFYNKYIVVAIVKNASNTIIIITFDKENMKLKSV